MRAFAPVSVAIVVCVAAPAFASGQSHVSAARKAEKRGDWRKALKEWKAAYKAEVNAEYLIGIGDAYVHLGNKAEAKKSYESYLSDPLALPAVAAKPDTGRKEQAPAGATKEPPKPARPIAMATPSPERTAVPVAAVAVTPFPRETQARSSSGVQRTMAFVTAGVAIAALGGGAYAFTQANSAHNDLTGKVHSGAEAQRLLETERQNKTLSFVGLAGGLVAAGIATALFAF